MKTTEQLLEELYFEYISILQSDYCKCNGDQNLIQEIQEKLNL